MDNGELEKSFEGVEVSIAVQQCVLFTQAERGDQAVYRLPYGVTATPKSTIVAGRLSCQREAARFEHLEFRQLFLNLFGREVVANALQYLAQDDVGESKALAVEFGIQPIRLRILGTLEVVDPNGAVDNNHALLG